MIVRCSQTDMIAALDQRIVDTLAQSDADLKEAALDQADKLKESLSTFEECTADGLGYVVGLQNLTLQFPLFFFFWGEGVSERLYRS